MQNISYVYIYRHPLSGTPFYVGKGSKKRAHTHLKEAFLSLHSVGKSENRNEHFISTIKKLIKSGYHPIIEFYSSGLSNKEACDLEVFLISKFGRRDLGTGPLTNLTPGGDGVTGRVNILVNGKSVSILKSQYDPLKHTHIYKGKKFSDEVNKTKGHPGRVWSEEVKQKIASSHKGKHKTLAHLANISKANKGKKKPLSEETLVQRAKNREGFKWFYSKSLQQESYGKEMPLAWELGRLPKEFRKPKTNTPKPWEHLVPAAGNLS